MNTKNIDKILRTCKSIITIKHTAQGCKVVTTEHVDRDGTVAAQTIELSGE